MKMNDYNKVYIGVTGKAGSGKDAFCDFLMDNVGDHIVPHRVALADPLKRTVSELYGIQLDCFYDRKLKEKTMLKIGVLEFADDNSVTTPRKILQQFGTDIVRKMDTDHWIKRFPKEVHTVLEDWFSYTMYGYGHETGIKHINYTRKVFEAEKGDQKDIQLIIVPDVRFENEQRLIKDSNGYLVNISRDDPDVGEIDTTHLSETSITENIKPDFEIDNNYDLINLKLKSIAVLNKLGLR